MYIVFIFATVQVFLSARARRQAEGIYRDYYAVLRRRCKRLLRDEHRVDDVMQEIFWTICRKLGQYKGDPKEILPWLYRITTTHCLKHIEKDQRWNRNIESAIEEGIARYRPCFGSNEVDAWVAGKSLLAKLPPSQREVVLYRFASGMTQEEIAEVMQITRDQVRVLLKRFKEIAARWRQEASNAT